MVKQCVHVDCEKQRQDGQLCRRHYRQLADWTPTPVEELARLGRNVACVDCGDRPLFGGMRCHECFLTRVERRRKTSDHLFPDRASTPSTYSAGCRCWDCRKVANANRTMYRRKARV